MEVKCVSMDWICLAEDVHLWQAVVNMTSNYQIL
jgi:hypothetical protein